MGKIFDFKEKIDNDKIIEVASELKNGKLAVFPTETVYGIGTNAFDKEAVSKIFKAKGREGDNPLIVHVCDTHMLKDVVSSISKLEEKIIAQFMPGPLTIILPKSEKVSYNVTGGLDTVGVRIPTNLIAINLIKNANVPIAAPSANISGKPSGTNIDDIKEELIDRVDYIIDNGNTEIGLESTVIKVENEVINILRPGKITRDDFEKLGYSVKLDSHIFKAPKVKEKVESPGMKYRHYAPNVSTILVESNNDENKVEAILNLVNSEKNKTFGVIGVSENKEKYLSLENVKYIDMGSRYNLDEISKNMFSNLRKLDNLDLDLCYIESIKKEGIGIAIMNRLVRSCNYNVINV